MSLKKAVGCIRKNKRFLLTAHINVEGDALGSELAFYRLLRKLKKKAVIVNADTSFCDYSFMPGLSRIMQAKKKMRLPRFDVFVALDCSDISRAGETQYISQADKPVLNIDHHISNTYFGSVNWIDTEASSTAEMVYRLFKVFKIPIDKESALALYVGMLTDTGSFRYPNTTAKTHRAVAELLSHRLNITQIHKNIYGNIQLADVQLITKVLAMLKSDLGGKMAWFSIPRKVLASRKNSTLDLTDHVLSFARAIKGVEVAVLFKENIKPQDGIRVNLRSQGKVNVNAIARFFGGGGHRTASGCTVQATLTHARKAVLQRIRQALLKL
ncbi:MAG: bifunctional oligoribonuclease/PAP phosphatase NrnA [Candidatus Omnitrophota bacterium]|jgi:phosphoesterase RecJ-like protein|nr:MAG: bifunctional oligoribonuclease/PAP phosphatase NrnA [Candidatus Omnitrophota bacterium]